MDRLKKSLFLWNPLFHDGVATVEIFKKSELSDIRNRFEDAEKSFPEFKKDAPTYVLGSFAAYGNPAAFHNALVKEIRQKTFDRLYETQIFINFLNPIVDDSGASGRGAYKLEVLFDRMMHRRPKQKPTAETVHRDVTPANKLHEGDFIFGGWINLDDTLQHFSCLPGSHRKPTGEVLTSHQTAQSGDGFNVVTDSVLKAHFSAKKRCVEVPPGHLIIFLQHILHEVLAKTNEQDMYRLFTGWRLTKGDAVLFGKEKKRWIDELDVPLLPSGQKPPICSKLHFVNFRNKPFSVYPNLPPMTTLQWIDKSLNKPLVDEKGSESARVRRFMKGLCNSGYESVDDYKYDTEAKNLMLNLHELL